MSPRPHVRRHLTVSSPNDVLFLSPRRPRVAKTLTDMALLCILALSAAATVPSFPIDFYSGVQSGIIISQGGVSTATGACCSPDAPACKVNTISSGSDTYQQGTMNRTLQIGGATGVVMKWYGKSVDKMMGLAPGATANSTHKYVCALYCPLRGAPFESLVAIGGAGERVKDLGTATKSQTGLPGGKTKVRARPRACASGVHSTCLAALTSMFTALSVVRRCTDTAGRSICSRSSRWQRMRCGSMSRRPCRCAHTRSAHDSHPPCAAALELWRAACS